GVNSTTFSSSTLVDGDVVTASLVSSDVCADPTPVNSGPVTMNVNNTLPVSVSITSSDADNSICTGESVTFTANPTNGGGSPMYQWYLNGTAQVGETGVSFTTSSLINNDDVYVVLTSSEACATGSPATSSPISTAVNSTTTVSANGPYAICVGQSVNLNGVVGGGATTGTWSGGTGTFTNANDLNAVYTPTPAEEANGTVTLTLTNTDGCGTVSDNALVNISSGPQTNLVVTTADTICRGENAEIIISLSEINVSYRAYIGASAIGGDTQGNGADISLVIPNFEFGPGDNTITIKATGCGTADMTTSPVVRKSDIADPIVLPSGSDLCSNATVTINSSAPGAVSYRWYLDGAMVVGQTTNSHTAHAPGIYQLRVRDVLGCEVGSLPVNISRGPAAPVIVQNPTSGSTELSLTGGAGFSNFQWYAGKKAIYSANATNYTAYYNAYYTLAAQFNNCRIVSDSVLVNNPGLEDLARKNFYSNDSVIFILPPYLDEELTNIYPNPAHDAFTVKYVSQVGSEVVFELFDGLGHKVLNRVIPVSTGMIKEDFTDLNLSGGIYLMHIKEGDKKVVKTIMIK
ncbi:MAG: T9SS type A sorting domain-containing protein, partial [Cytophagaceae bacterium]